MRGFGLRGVWWIARRDLAGYFHGPVGFLLAALFLALQGTVFWIFVRFLGRPDAPPGGLPEIFFGGTMLYWVAVAVVAAAVPMRLVAEERRAGTLETLLTAPVGFGEIVVGKWLAAWIFQIFLWAPTLLYWPFVSSTGASTDTGAVAAGYAGTLLVGAATLALGLLASTVSRHQLVAAAGSLVGLFLLLLLGAVAHQVTSPSLALLLRRTSLFAMMEDFGRGIVDTRAVALLVTGTVLPLLAATRILAWDRPREGTDRRGRVALAFDAVGAVLVITLAVLANVLLDRHAARTDWTKGALFTLSPKAVAVAEGLPEPVSITIFRYPDRRSETDRLVSSLLNEVVERLRGHAPERLSVNVIDPDRAPARAEQAARAHGISAFEMSEGVVVVTSAKRSRVITREDLIDEEIDLASGTRKLQAFRGEGALVTALLTVSDDRAPSVCFSQGRGEPHIDSTEPAGYGTFADDLRRDAYEVRGLERLESLAAASGGGQGHPCDVLVLAEPQVAFAAAEWAAVDRLLDGGGAVLLMAGPVFDQTGAGFRQTGAERWLTGHTGLTFADAVVVDPVHGSDVEGPSVWTAREGAYARHPITDRLEGRLTTWSRTRPLRFTRDTAAAGQPAPGRPGASPFRVEVLVRSSAESWGETDLATLRGEADLKHDRERDQKGPLAVAAAAERPMNGGRRARIVAVGTGRLVTNDRLAGLLIRDYNRDFVLSAVAWLADRQARSGIGPKMVTTSTTTKMTTRMTTTTAAIRPQVEAAATMRAFILFCVGLPVATLGLGGVVWWRRRV